MPLRQFKKNGTPKHFQAGEDFFLPNAEGDLVLILSGITKVYTGWEKRRNLIQTAGKNDMLGFLEIFLRKKTLISMRALTDCETVILSKDLFWMILETDDRAMFDVIKKLAGIACENRCHYFGYKNNAATPRIAEALVQIHSKLGALYQAELSQFSPDELGQLTGLPVKQVLSGLRYLSTHGFIRRKENRVTEIRSPQNISRYVTSNAKPF